MDAHTKVFTLFLDTLTELVVSHKADMTDWLYVLLTRLLNKLGADLLGSIIQKINRTLEVVRLANKTLALPLKQMPITKHFSVTDKKYGKLQKNILAKKIFSSQLFLIGIFPMYAKNLLSFQRIISVQRPNVGDF